MQRVPLLIGRRKRGLRSFSSRSEIASFLGGMDRSTAVEARGRGKRSSAVPREMASRYRPTRRKRLGRSRLEPVKTRITLRTSVRSQHGMGDRSVMKHFGLLAVVSLTGLVSLPSTVSAQQKTLYVAGYGGSFEKTIRDEVIPAFEQANGVKVEYVAGNSTD